MAEPQIKIEIDEATARGTYSNLAFVTHSETEFIVDFAFLQPQPQAPKAKVLTRIITSPTHLKRLVWALQDNIAKYEARFGPIQAGEQPGEPAKSVDFYQ